MKILAALILFAMASVSAFAQTYIGSWRNTTFGSSGALTVMFTADPLNGTISGSFDLDGNVLGGSDPPAFGFSGTLNADGTYSLTSSTALGDISASGDLRAGTITLQITNLTGFESLTFEATASDKVLRGRYTIRAIGGSVFARGTLTARNQSASTGGSFTALLLDGGNDPLATLDLTVRGSGRFTGTLSTSDTRIPVRGSFGPGGAISFASGNDQINLFLDSNSGSLVGTATVDSQVFSNVELAPTAFTGRRGDISPDFKKRLNILLPHEDFNSGLVEGGYLTARVNKDGSLSLLGRTPAGNRIRGKVRGSLDSGGDTVYPVRLQTRGRNGEVLIGQLTLLSNPGSNPDITGSIDIYSGQMMSSTFEAFGMFWERPTGNLLQTHLNSPPSTDQPAELFVNLSDGTNSFTGTFDIIWPENNRPSINGEPSVSRSSLRVNTRLGFVRGQITDSFLGRMKLDFILLPTALVGLDSPVTAGSDSTYGLGVVSGPTIEEGTVLLSIPD